MREQLRGHELPPLVGGILVGGGSRRMGSPKALLEWQGESFVERIAGALATAVEEVVLLGSETGLPVTAARLPVVADTAGVRGPLAGLLAAFAARPGAAWLIASCDQPLVDAALLAWLVAERRQGRIAVLPRLAPDRIEPFPGVYEPACRATLAALAGPRERASLQPLAAVPGVHLAQVPARLAGALRGANTPAELADLRRVAGPPTKDPHRDG